jgi:hypothetical protein
MVGRRGRLFSTWLRPRRPSSFFVLVAVARALVATQDVHTRVAGRRRCGQVVHHQPYSSSSSSSASTPTLRYCSHVAPEKRRSVTKPRPTRHLGAEWGRRPRPRARATSPPQGPGRHRHRPEPGRGPRRPGCGGVLRNSVRWTVALALGLRQSEALALQWTDVDLLNHTLTVRRSIHRARELQRHKATQLGERMLAGSEWHDQDLVSAQRPSGVGRSRVRPAGRRFRRAPAGHPGVSAAIPNAGAGPDGAGAPVHRPRGRQDALTP